MINEDVSNATFASPATIYATLLTVNPHPRTARAARLEARDRFETILEKYGYLLDLEVKNDVFDMLTVLSVFYAASEMFGDFEEKTKYDALFNVATNAATTLDQVVNIVKKHKLLEAIDFYLSYEHGEPPKFAHKVVKLSESNISSFEGIAKDAVRFKDRCQEFVFTRQR